MRLAVNGTLLASEMALEGACVMNVGGGYHHAFSDHGEGFCVYADVAIAIRSLRERGRIKSNDSILVIDLDAHRGNGLEDILGGDPGVSFFDMYNFQVYPGLLEEDECLPFVIPLRTQLSGLEYLEVLRSELVRFLAAVPPPKLVFYLAGTDIVSGDPLGKLAVGSDQVHERDRFVLDSVRALNVPTVIVTAGGYTEESHRLISRLMVYLCD